MASVLEKLKAARHAIRVVDLGSDVRLGLRLITELDYMQAGIAAVAAMRQRGETEATIANADLFEAEKTTQVLAKAVVDPDTQEPLFKDAASFAGAVTREQKNALVAAYLEHEAEYSPHPETIGESAFAELMETLKKTPETVNLSGLSYATLKRLITTLAAQPAN